MGVPAFFLPPVHVAHLVQAMHAGAVDFIGDVHGELDALQRLLALLGYEPHCGHAQERRLVFLGDLVDRGPDSPGVVRLVQQLVEAGRAQCLLGNHELNLLLGKRREGNEWFRGEAQQLREGGVLPQVLAGDAERESILAFLRQLPLVLERPGLCAVHACWDAASLDKLRAAEGPADQVFEAWRLRIDDDLCRDAVDRHSLEADLRRQNLNPVTVATSGLEKPAEESFWAGGRQRRVQRLPWWRRYQEQTTVVFGHYWRSLDPSARQAKSGPYLFHQEGAEPALGPLANAFCIDYSVGHRNVERAQGMAYGLHTALAALRLPEREVLLDRGEPLPVRAAVLPADQA